MQQVSTFLWFDGRAEEAADHYTGVFTDAKILETQRTLDGGVSTVTFELAGQRYIAYNGGPEFSFTGAAISPYVECDNQDEIDTLWAGLADGGREGPGGSLTDRFGVTWQILPTTLHALLDNTEPEAADRVLTALHAMTKIDIQTLIDARDGQAG